MGWVKRFELTARNKREEHTPTIGGVDPPEKPSAHTDKQ